MCGVGRVSNFKERAMPKFLVNVVYTSDGAKGLRSDGGYQA